MPKRKREKTLEDIIEEVGEVEEIIAGEVEALQPEPKTDLDRKRDELLKHAEDGDLDKSVAYVKKASAKIIEKLYVEYDRKRMQKVNEFLTDLFISKFTSLLGGLDAIEDSGVLEKELQKDALLRRDV